MAESFNERSSWRLYNKVFISYIGSVWHTPLQQCGCESLPTLANFNNSTRAILALVPAQHALIVTLIDSACITSHLYNTYLWQSCRFPCPITGAYLDRAWVVRSLTRRMTFKYEIVRMVIRYPTCTQKTTIIYLWPHLKCLYRSCWHQLYHHHPDLDLLCCSILDYGWPGMSEQIHHSSAWHHAWCLMDDKSIIFQ